jgi:hypothetical protein
VTLRVGPTQGRATVVLIDGATLTVVTAAHFLAPGDVGRGLVVRHQGHTLKGRVSSVTRNPAFHPPRSRHSPELSTAGTVGVDTEVVAIEIEPRGGDDRQALGEIRPADLAARRTPRSPGQVVVVHVVDQSGAEHVVRAGNHLNPHCRAWGRGAYDTLPGDSGSGVFMMARTARGGAWPVLVGVVSQADDRGGIASLVHRDAPWLADALGGARPGAGPASPTP